MIFSTFLLAVYFPVSSHSQMILTTTCNAQLVNNEHNESLLGEASMYWDSYKDFSIVIKWQNGTVLTATRTEISGNHTSWKWVNNAGNSGTMSLDRTSSAGTSFSGPFTFNNITSSITLLNCRYDGENQEIPGIGVFFHNTGTIPLTVLVNQTDGPRPPDPSQSTVVFSGPPTSTRNSAAGLSLAYGCYSFCVHWDTGKTDRLNQIIYSYRFIGRLPDRPAICLNENTPTIPAPVVRVSTGEPVATGVGYAGQCPGVGQAGQRNHPLTPQQICARDVPGSVWSGEIRNGTYICNCPQGMVWKDPNTKKQCVAAPQITPQEVCARDLPGSIYSGERRGGSYVCNCPSGTTWNQSRTRCVRAPSPPGPGIGPGSLPPCMCTDPETGKRFRPFLGQDCANATATNMMDFNCQ